MTDTSRLTEPARVPDDVVADLQREALWLATRFRQPQVQTPGASGILNALSPATIWVHRPDVDLGALLHELRTCPHTPYLMLPPGLPDTAAQLTAA